MGETDEDIIDLAFALREIGVDSLPVNLLHAIDGTPFGDEIDSSGKGITRPLLVPVRQPASGHPRCRCRERNLGAWAIAGSLSSELDLHSGLFDDTRAASARG